MKLFFKVCTCIQHTFRLQSYKLFTKDTRLILNRNTIWDISDTF